MLEQEIAARMVLRGSEDMRQRVLRGERRKAPNRCRSTSPFTSRNGQIL
jgi:hypothetical protein